jgi:hypothetical protein
VNGRLAVAVHRPRRLPFPQQFLAPRRVVGKIASIAHHARGDEQFAAAGMYFHRPAAPVAQFPGVRNVGMAML